MPQIAFKPDWTRHAKAAPFKRNDQMLEVLPIGVIVFPGTGIQDNLADKAQEARHSGLEIRERRRVSAAIGPYHLPAKLWRPCYARRCRSQPRSFSS